MFLSSTSLTIKLSDTVSVTANNDVEIRLNEAQSDKLSNDCVFKNLVKIKALQ
jgi:hypothetical protein